MIRSNQSFEFFMDFGVIGHQPIEVIYDWDDGKEGGDLSKNNLPVIKSIFLFINNKAVGVTHLFSDNFKNVFCYVIKEHLELSNN